MELIQKAEDYSPTAALIHTFTTEPYRSEARQIGRDVLLKTKSYDRFQDLFSTVVESVTMKTSARSSTFFAPSTSTSGHSSPKHGSRA